MEIKYFVLFLAYFHYVVTKTTINEFISSFILTVVFLLLNDWAHELKHDLSSYSSCVSILCALATGGSVET